MPRRRGIACAIVLCAAEATGVRAQGACERAQTAATLPAGRAVVIAPSAQPRCVVEFVRTGVALDGEADPAVEDFARFAARAPDGRYFTYHNGRLHVWSANGVFQRVVGAPGRGPGEFAAGAMTVDFAADGRVIVGDNNRRWSVFSSGLALIGTVPYGESGGSGSLRGLILGDGTLAGVNNANSGTGAITRYELQLPAAAGGTVPLPRRAGEIAQLPPSRSPVRLAAGDSGRFWAVRLLDDGARYVAELRNSSGALSTTIERRAAWLTRHDGGAQPRPAPEIELVHDDGSGLLVVFVMSPNARWSVPTTPPRDEAEFRRLHDAMVDIYVDVIDVRAGSLLAQAGPLRPSVAVRQLPDGFFPLSRSAYRREESASGTVAMQMLEMRLRRDGPSSDR